MRDKDGKRIRLIFDRREEAVALISKVEDEKYKQKLANVGLGKSPTLFSEIIQEALSSKTSLAPKSYIKYEEVYVVFEDFIKENKIAFNNEFRREHETRACFERNDVGMHLDSIPHQEAH